MFTACWIALTAVTAVVLAVVYTCEAVKPMADAYKKMTKKS